MKLTSVFYFSLIMTEALRISRSEMQRGIKLQFKQGYGSNLCLA